MRIKATFVGADGSLGYEKGKEYDLKIESYSQPVISRTDGTGECKYNNFRAFLRNWDNIKTR